MKKIILILMLVICIGFIRVSADVKVVSLKGSVLVRHGMEENWKPIAAGGVLKPEDSIQLEKKSSATVLLDGKTKLILPELVIIDISDLRNLSQEEFLLKLSMEQIRSIPDREGRDELNIPRTTTIHGANRLRTSTSDLVNSESGMKQLNGTKVLYEHGYYETCVLKTKQIFRTNPDLAKTIDMRLMIAGSFEMMNLYGEALTEYSNISHESLSQLQRSFVEQKIESLKNRNNKSQLK